MPTIDECKSILVTGGTAGIGRALATALAKLPSKPQIIISGRRQQRLDELAQSGIGNIGTIQADLNTDKHGIKKFADEVLAKYPNLDAVILNAGVQHEIYFKTDFNLDRVLEETNINYTSVVTQVAYLLPHFLKLAAQGRPCYIITVTSGLAIVPGPWVASYSASKAAMHSFTTSLRAQLKDTGVYVTEIIPPLVESELHDAYGTTQALSKFWMPLDEFTRITMEGLRRGADHVSAGHSAEVFRRYDEGKDEQAQAALERRAKW